MDKKIVAFTLFLIAILASCTQYQYTPPVQTELVCPDGNIVSCSTESSLENVSGETENMGEEVKEIVDEEKTEEPSEAIEEIVDEEKEAELKEPDAVEADIVVVEGELVKLEPKVSDEDSDSITITFSKPLDESGEWQTEIGDAGLYEVLVTASDGKNEASKTYVILVTSENAAPEITADDVEVDEGDRVVIGYDVTDSDGDDVEVSFSGWMDSDEKKTGFDDAGQYEVTITATDGMTTVTKTITVTVFNVNRAPEITELSGVDRGQTIVTEGELVEIGVDAEDEDGDDLTIEFSEPLDENGEWQTEIGDEGNYVVTITVSDGIDERIEDVLIIVEGQNKAPVFESIGTVEVDEGDTVILEPSVYDPEGEDVLISYSGWMESDTYETTYDDAGDHIVTITYSDGAIESSEDVLVVVNDVNRPPVFLE